MMSMFIGAGLQIFCVTVCTLIGSFYDEYFDKGAILGIATAIFPWFGFINGYTAARFYTFFNGSSWTKLACYTSMFLPSLISNCCCVIDFCEWIETGRMDSYPIREATVLSYYWFFIHMPSAFAGSYIGFIRKPIEPPVKKNRMVREVEDGTECPGWVEIPMIGIMAAFLPTMVLMLQLWQIMGNVNGPANIHAMHSMFYVVFALFLIVVIESALLLNYATLTSDQPNWWWRVWCGSSLIGVYVFIIMAFYLIYDLRVEYVTTLISYFTACYLVSCLIGLMSSSLAMIFTFRFNLKIYSKVKDLS